MFSFVVKYTSIVGYQLSNIKQNGDCRYICMAFVLHGLLLSFSFDMLSIARTDTFADYAHTQSFISTNDCAACGTGERMASGHLGSESVGGTASVLQFALAHLHAFV